MDELLLLPDVIFDGCYCLQLLIHRGDLLLLGSIQLQYSGLEAVNHLLQDIHYIENTYV